MSLIVDRLGKDRADLLSTRVGGTRVFVPNSIDDHSGKLRDRLGDDLFGSLVFHFGGTRLYVPRPENDRRTGQEPVDDRRIASLTKRGWSAARIARKLGCSDRTVHGRRAKFRHLDKH